MTDPKPIEAYEPEELFDLFREMTPEEQAQAAPIVLEQVALRDPSTYAYWCSEGKFERPPHVKLIAEAIRKLVDGELLDAAGRPCRKLLIMAPPRHGKSEQTSRYGPAWFETKFPDRRCMLCSYEADFAASWGRKVRDLIAEHPEFGVSVRRDSGAANRWDLVGRNGGMVTAGVGGPITGKGAHLLIIDDPVKNAEEAASAAMQERAWDWYRQTAFTRLEPGGVVVLIMTRWHEGDLGGRILAHEGDEWHVIRLPALAEADDPLGREPGEALWPARYSADDLAAIRRTMLAQPFEALYQQSPTLAEGGLFLREWFRYWTPIVSDDRQVGYNLGGLFIPDKETIKFSTVDLAASLRTSADYTVASTWVLTRTDPVNLVLIDVERMRLEGPDHMALLRRVYDKHKPQWIGVEKATFGLTLIQQATRAGLPIRELKPDRDKVARALPAAEKAKCGQVWWPQSASWLQDWELEILAFNPAGTHAHDDQVDTFSYAAKELEKRRSWVRREKPKEPETMAERVWDKMVERKRAKRLHPELGRF